MESGTDKLIRQSQRKSGTLDTMHDAQAVAIEHMELPKKIAWIVRRLTPTECERLQGYPDDYTNIGDWTDSKGKKHKYADSPRYKALGNSIALPQWFWLVQRMRPYLKEKPTLGSLFDGLGGFPLVWQRAYGEGTARWASEIEEFPMAVTKGDLAKNDYLLQRLHITPPSLPRHLRKVQGREERLRGAQGIRV